MIMSLTITPDRRLHQKDDAGVTWDICPVWTDQGHGSKGEKLVAVAPFLHVPKQKKQIQVDVVHLPRHQFDSQ